MKKVLVLCIFILITSLLFSVPILAAVDYSGIIEGEGDWLAELQTPTGAIRLSKGISNQVIDGLTKRVTTIEPYFANWAVIGLLENSSEQNIDVARKWIQWYFNHLNMPDYNGLNGSVYVHYSDADDPNIDYPAYKYDSTDSYAGTFLTLLKKFYEVTGDSNIITANKEKIELIAGAMIATQQADGLTFAKPDYRIKYLMDATETYDGFACAEWLESNVLNDSENVGLYKQKKELIYNGIQNLLWNPEKNTYNWNMNAVSEWKSFYPESGAQTFPIQCNVISSESERAIYLYNAMNEHFPDWQYNAYWTSQAYVAALMGDRDRVDAFIKSVEDMYIDQGRIWPWRASEAGHLMKAAKVIRDKSNLVLNKSAAVSINNNDASLINDGKLFTAWTANANDNEWIKLDFGDKKAFNRILIKWGDDYADKYQVLVSDDDINYTVFYDEAEGNGDTDDILMNTLAYNRYIKVVFTHLASLVGVNIKEIEVYSEEINLAAVGSGAMVTADSVNESYAPGMANDGNTRLQSSRWESNNTDSEHWLRVDLSEEKTIDTIRFWGVTDYPLKDYRVQYLVEKDGLRKWMDVASIVDNTTINPTHSFAPVTTKAIRIYISKTGDNRARIYEIEAFESNTKFTSYTYDVIVYGGTSAGVTAAIAAAREGVSVAIVAPEGRLGGMTSGGLGYVDIGKSFVVGGITDEYFKKIGQKYGLGGASYRVEPHVAETVFAEMAKEAKVDVYYRSRLIENTGVSKSEGRIKKLLMETGDEFIAKTYIDATYEGDLMAWSGVSYTVGREGSDQYGEAGAGVRTIYGSQGLNPYDDKGLLPDIKIEIPGPQGSGDNNVQAYTFRLCLTQNPDNKVDIIMPEGYDPRRYELLLQSVLRNPALTFDNLVSIAAIPNNKIDINNKGWYSTDLVNGSWGYPEGSYEERDAIWQDHKNYLQGFLYFLGNDIRVPETLRNEGRSWGLSKDEFADNDYWPTQLYVREARRMTGQYVMRQSDAWENYKKADTIGMGSYMIDSHFVQRYLQDGVVMLEGLTGHQPARPYEIPYSSITPVKNECENLLVPVAMSASHVMYGSIRMEPTYMIMGHASGVAAAMTAKAGNAVQDIHVTDLQSKLLAQGQVLQYDDSGIYLKSDFTGIVMDDREASFTGKWSGSANGIPYLDDGGYRYTLDPLVSSYAEYVPEIPENAIYDIYILYAPSTNRASNAKVTVNSADGKYDFIVDMKSIPDSGYPLYRIGRFLWNQGTGGSVTISNEGANGMVIADGVILVPIAYPSSDSIAPIASVTNATAAPGSYIITARSSETGTVYLVPEKNYIGKSELESVVALSLGTKAIVTKPGENTRIAAPLSEGIYKLYAVDETGNVSASSKGTIIVKRPSDNGPLINYALKVNGATASADSVNGSYTPDKAIDGNTSTMATRWLSKNIAGPHWLQIDFPGSINVNKVKLTGYPTYYMEDYAIQYLKDGVWVDAVNIKGNKSNTVLEHEFDTVNTASLRIYITKTAIDNMIRIYEFEIYCSATDSIAPVAYAESATIPAGTNVEKVTSSETGTIYLVPESSYANSGALENVVASGDGTKAAITIPGQNAIIKAPFKPQAYKLYAVDLSGNVSSASEGTITVIDITPPTAIITSAIAAPDEEISTALSTEAGMVYLVSSGGYTTKDSLESVADSVYGTKASVLSPNVNVILAAPMLDGDYKLYAVDESGNVSHASDGTITVEGSIPKAYVDSMTVMPGTIIDTAQSSETGYLFIVKAKKYMNIEDLEKEAAKEDKGSKVILTTPFGNTSIAAPLKPGIYRLYAVDRFGNISDASAGVITVYGEANDSEDEIEEDESTEHQESQEIAEV